MKKNLQKIWQGWKSFARILGNIQARIILTILYFILVSPVALVMVFFDPLKIKRINVKWISRENNNSNTDLLEEAKRQF